MTHIDSSRTLCSALVALVAMIGVGCVSEASQRLSLGSQCDLTSECEAPLVCRLERCRRECVSTRDCALGLRCVKAPDGLGVCQLPEERLCSLDSECIPPLACRLESCVNECAEDRDCPPGQRCDADSSSCVEVSDRLCVYHSDCPEPLVCNFRQQCQIECAEDRDCPGETACFPHADCNGMNCMCRIDCSSGEACPFGLECIECPDGLCDPGTMYCERIAEE